MDIFKNRMPEMSSNQSTGSNPAGATHAQGTPNQNSWIRELVSADEQLEKSVMIDMNLGLDTQRILVNESIQFLLRLKNDFAEAAASFNELKPSVLGRIKVYGIAKTHADFMLFRNGYKMIFSIKAAGVVSMRFHYVGNTAIPQPQAKENVTIVMDEEMFEAKWGAFEEVYGHSKANHSKHNT